ncbi:tetratricopeptide repeat protein [Pantoea sp.]|uniref:tetratricopeptide repeat protein n=1 Tax=Pantoea sp. TaxID=69393 RepID=UPI0031E02A58
MKTLFPLFAVSVLLSGCVAHNPPQSQLNQTSAPQFAEPRLLRDFSQQMDSTRQQAAAGARSAQQQYGGWLASAGQRDAAQPLLTAAAESGQVQAQYQLGMLLLDSQPREGKQWLQHAAEQGNSTAAQQLARYHRSGNPLIQDPQQAFNWLLHAAQQGDAQAQNDVGAAYSRGIGVKKNTALAAGWYRKAAEQGNALAQFNLAGAYQAGEGVKTHPLQAYAWYHVAVQNSRDPHLTTIAEQMKLRMYAAATRNGQAAQARQLAQQFTQQYVKPHEDVLP